MGRMDGITAMPSKAEAALARETSRILASKLRSPAGVELRLPGRDTRGVPIKVPASAMKILMRALDEIADGNAVALIPVRAELTTQEAAEILNVSRPSLIQLLERGQIEFRRIGTHRRVKLESLMRYKKKTIAQRRSVLRELAAYDQELGI
jgi:excisionase family DNA binding protein